MTKFNIQDRIVLDEMVDTFRAEMNKNQDDAETNNKRPIITREYWELIKSSVDLVSGEQEFFNLFSRITSLR